ncbi:MAG: autotransporter assembly complex protein TamA, partial [Planctomycetota bacterium]
VDADVMSAQDAGEQVISIDTLRAIGGILPGLGAADAAEREWRSVILNITPGDLFTVGAVRWRGDPVLELLPEELVRACGRLVGEPYIASGVEDIAAEVQRTLRNSGRQFATVSVHRQVDERRAVVDLELDVQPGPQLVIDTVRIDGADRVDESFIDHAAGLGPEELISTDALRQAQERLLRTGLFRSVSVDLQDADADADDTSSDEAESTDPDVEADPAASVLDPPAELRLSPLYRGLQIVLEEREPYEWRGRIGYGTVDDLRLGTDLIMLAPFGGPERIRVGAEANFRYQSVDAEYMVPWLFGKEYLTGSIRPFWIHAEEDRPRYDEYLYGATTAVSIRLTPSMRVRPGILGARIIDKERDPDLENTVYAPFVEWNWDRRDSSYKPHKGFTLWLRHEATSETLGSTLDYIKERARAAVYLPLGERFTLALGAEAGVIWTGDETESSELPRSFRFTAGGPFSVRGFEQDALSPRDADGRRTGGDGLLVLRSELRIAIWGDLHGALFSDWGNVFMEPDEIDFDELRQGVGPGLRYYTPAGALMLDAGWKVDPQPGEDDYELHLSFGMPF